jgi:putative ABC transport system ATP-binding protein
MSFVIVARNLVVRLGGRAVLDGLDLEVAAGRSVAVTGVSGAGKSTLLAVLAGLRRPDDGSVLLDGTDLWGLSPRGRAALRLAKIGMVFQSAELIPELTLAENVELVLRLNRRRIRTAAMVAEAVARLEPRRGFRR